MKKTFIILDKLRVNDIPVKHVLEQELGYEPLFGVPLTNFKDTLASCLLSSPDVPIACIIVETEDFIRIDKVSWINETYKHIQDSNYIPKITKVSEDTPDELCEFIIGEDLEIKQYGLYSYINKSPILSINLSQTVNPFNNEETEKLVKMIDNVGFGLYLPEGKEIKKALFDTQKNFFKFKYSMLPILIDGKLSKEELKPYMAKATNQNIDKLQACVQKLGRLSVENLTNEKYEDIFEETRSYIIDDEEVLKALFSDSVKRNDKCPCGSEKKFKKCHGR